jgi:hypothetical protein
MLTTAHLNIKRPHDILAPIIQLPQIVLAQALIVPCCPNNHGKRVATNRINGCPSYYSLPRDEPLAYTLNYPNHCQLASTQYSH